MSELAGFSPADLYDVWGPSPGGAGVLLDQASPVPFYEQLTAILRREIASGRLPPGKIEGGEDRLAQRYGVSRPTVPRALDTLQAEGLFTPSRSKGNCVLSPPGRRPQRSLRASGGWH